MRSMLKFAIAAIVIVAAIPALAQATGASIAVEGPYARATPAGAQTGAVYMTIDNKSSAADRLTGRPRMSPPRFRFMK